ncbi:VOC family protein [Yoonia sp. BS5-3]|uniref:VOC family protein n=1 Tax=Yoonia phaeophyticola TaxID=3137369 RepID=A0ABZ2V3B5_9RHOB
MVQVLGIGGFFFRAKDPAKLAEWYDRHLGVTKMGNYGDPEWNQEAGPTVFAPFESDTDYFGRKEQSWMINFRVANLDDAIADLRAAGIEVDVDPELHPNGRFARLVDPEGNPVELWEPLQTSV